MTLYKDKKTGLWCRPDTLDEYVIREQSSYRALFELCRNKTVLDIGGNIGAFAYFALENGASEVFSFEPDPQNATIYRKQHLKSTLFQEAISSKTGTSKLFLNSGKNKGLHSLQKIQGREFIPVMTRSFKQVLKTYSPEVIKIDIEGGEYNLNLEELPSYVESIAIELHLTHGNNREQAVSLIKSLKSQFPNILKAPSVTDKNWTTLFIGTRR